MVRCIRYSITYYALIRSNFVFEMVHSSELPGRRRQFDANISIVVRELHIAGMLLNPIMVLLSNT